MNWKKKEKNGVAAVSQLRSGQVHPFGALRSFAPLGGGEERLYRQIREAIPVLDAAVGKLVRLSGGFTVKCRDGESQRKLEEFLDTCPCGRGQVGMDSFLAGYLDSLLTYGRAIGELVVAGGKLRAVCWGDVTALDVCEGDNPMEIVLWGPDSNGRMHPLPYPHLLLFTTLNPEAKHPYGVSLFRGMPFLADILMKIYNTMGINWERAGNVRYSVVYKNGENMDPATAQERSNRWPPNGPKPWRTAKTARSGILWPWGMCRFRLSAEKRPFWIPRCRCDRFWNNLSPKPACRPSCWA